MEIELEIEIFDPNCKTTLSIDDTVSLNELIEFIQTTHQEKLRGIEMSGIQIQIGGSDQVINPSNCSLQQVLRGQKKAKLYLQRKQLQANQLQANQLIANQNSFQEYQSGSQNRAQQRNPVEQTNSQTRNQPQVFTTIPQPQQQVFNTQPSRLINLIIRNGGSQIQTQFEDSLTIQDVIQNCQQSLNIDPHHYHLYYGTINLSQLNPSTTLKQLGMQHLGQLDWKYLSQVNQMNQQTNFNQRAVQQPNMINQSNLQGQNFGGQTQYNQQQNQAYNQAYNQTQFQQQQYQQQYQQQNVQQTNVGYQQQQYQQQQNNQQQQQQKQIQGNQQQTQQGQIGQSQLNNPQGSNPKSNPQIQPKQITINFEIQDGQIRRQFSTITTTNNSLLQMQDAVYQYLGISKDAASVDLFINETPLGGSKLSLTLEMLQLTRDNQTFKVKVRWVGG